MSKKQKEKGNEQESGTENVVLYKGKNGEVELRADGKHDTIWATQEQISRLFDVSRPNVTMHLGNIFETEELDKNSVCKESLHTGADGKQYKVTFYNLDAIIAIGYRVNSKSATQFRIWATGVLKDYVVRGYKLNQYRLGKSPEALVGLYDAISMLESEDIPGRLKGKIIVKLEKELKPTIEVNTKSHYYD